MNYNLHSYRFAEEIIKAPNHLAGFTEIDGVVKQCPLFTFPNKSAKNARLDVVQQLLNTFFDRRFAVDLGWDYHPPATQIANSNLAADYRKTFGGLRIQAEIQFGNMSRWYSDIFKFQTAYSQGLIDMGLCIVPMASIATRIDSNVTQYERCVRELPSAKLSITLPILILGIYEDAQTTTVNVSTAGFANIRAINGKGQASNNRYRIVNGILAGNAINTINGNSPTGDIARALVQGVEEEGEDD